MFEKMLSRCIVIHYKPIQNIVNLEMIVKTKI